MQNRACLNLLQHLHLQLSLTLNVVKMLYIFKKLHFLYYFYDFLKICAIIVSYKLIEVYKIMEKLTKQKIKDFKKQSNNALTKYVCTYIISHCGKGKNVSDFIKNILNCGCESGIVDELIYYCDTLKFYKKFQYEIVNLLNDLLYGCGCNTPELFGNK